MSAVLTHMAAPSPPIDIKGPSRTTSTSPQNHSNLTSALQQAATDGMDVSYDRDATRSTGLRHDSLGVPNSMGIPHPGARPISVGANRRGSNTSFMGPMSFGGMSMNSWMQDDIMMTGTSPFNPNPVQSPSYHSSSYLPKMEADFWRNLRCCDMVFKDLHELLQHFEDAHRDNGSNYPSNRMYTPGKGAFFRRKSSTPAVSGLPNQDLLRQNNPQRNFNAAQTQNNLPTNYQQPQQSQQSQQQQPQQPPPQDGMSRSGFDMDTIGEMEMDFGDAAPFPNQPNPNPEHARMRPGPINAHLANAQHLATPQSSQPSTPATARPTPASNNPMVSSVNTPSFTTGATTTNTTSAINSPLPTTTAPFGNDAGMLTALNNDFSNMDFNPNALNNGMNSDMFELTINDPARALFSENGGINATQAQLFGFVNGASTNPDSHGGAMQPSQMGPQADGGSGIAPLVDPYGGEDRPFKCLVIGCEKAYKNANGLRYHERHGHSSQQLTKNADGTLSIVNPETGEAFPGTIGMEKEKPYRCDACGKRYKNLNGLKYHKNHSPPCNPDLDVSKVSLPAVVDGVAGGGGGGGGMDGMGWDAMGVGVGR